MIQYSKNSEESRKIQLGINGERFVVAILETIIGKKRLQKCWFHIKHHDWGTNYSWGYGTDITVYDEKGEPMVDVEVKNWKNQSKPYGTDVAEKHIIPRFRGSLAPVKLLLISFLSLLTYKAREIIRQANIEIIEIENWIVKATWKETLKNFMAQYYRKFRGFLRLSSSSFSSKSLSSKPTRCNSLATSIVSYTDTINDKKEHDTNIAICKRFGLEATVKEGNKSFG